MKDLHQVLEQKKMEIERVRREIEALHFVIPLLAEDADWIENGPGSAALAIARNGNCRPERVKWKHYAEIKRKLRERR